MERKTLGGWWRSRRERQGRITKMVEVEETMFKGEVSRVVGELWEHGAWNKMRMSSGSGGR